MKVYYIAGFLFAGIFGTFSLAHASEAPMAAVNSYSYAQPAPSVQTRRIVRVVQSAQPRAVMINGAYVMSDMVPTATTRRVRVMPAQPKLKVTPNLYKTTATSNMPVMYSRQAMQAR